MAFAGCTALVVSAWLARGLDDVAVLARQGPAAVGALLGGLFCLGGAAVASAQRAAAERSHLGRVLELLPVSRLTIAAALSVPASLVVMGLTAVTVWPVVAALTSAAGTGTVPALVAATGVVIAGGGAGLAAWYLSRWLCGGRVPYLVHVVTLALWAVPCIATFALAQSLGTTGSTADLPGGLAEVGWRHLLLVWPVAAGLLLEPGWGLAVAIALALAWVAGLTGLAIALGLRAGIHIPLRARRPSVQWRMDGRLPMVRLEVVRLTRAAATRAGLTGATMVLLLGASAQVFLTDLDPVGIGVAAGLLAGFFLAQAAYRARGLSSRAEPYPVLAGIHPVRWAGAVAAAVGATVLLFAVVGVGGLGALSGSPGDAVLFGTVTYALLGSAALLTGFVLVPSADTAVSEFLVLWLLSLAVVPSVGGFLDGPPFWLAAAAALVGAGLVAGSSVLVEHLRWRARSDPSDAAVGRSNEEAGR